MAFTSISKEDLKDRGVTGLPDTPQLTTEEMQRKFDELAKEVLVPAFNRLVEELAKETAAANIGITIPEGLEAEPNIAAIIEWLLKDSGESDRLRHSHDNKSILDSITSNVKSGYDNLVNLLSSIEEISNVVKNSENSLPTGSAIVDYMIGLGGGDMLRAVYDSNCSGIVDDSEKLGGKSPEFYEDAIEEVKEMAKNGGKNLIGDEFVPEKDYFTGDYAIKDNVLYRFVQDKAAGAWDETAVESTTIEVELHALNAKIAGILLWENPNPKVTFNSQTINLSSSDYDSYEIYWATAANNSYISTNKSLKGHGTTLFVANADKTSVRRQIDYISDTQLKANDGYGIPIKIIGYKL